MNHPDDEKWQDFDNCLRPVALLSDGEHRRLWRFIMELQLGQHSFQMFVVETSPVHI